MSAIADIMSEARRSRDRAVTDERENMQYRMRLAGETIKDSVRGMTSLLDAMERCYGKLAFMDMLRLHVGFIDQRAERLLKGE